MQEISIQVATESCPPGSKIGQSLLEAYTCGWLRDHFGGKGRLLIKERPLDQRSLLLRKRLLAKEWFEETEPHLKLLDWLMAGLHNMGLVLQLQDLLMNGFHKQEIISAFRDVLTNGFEMVEFVSIPRELLKECS